MSEFPDYDFLDYLISHIVSKPEAVQIERKVDELGVLFSVRCAQEDMGLLIGKEGSTAKAIRTLLRIVGIRIGTKPNLRILESDGSPSRHGSDFRADAIGSKAIDVDAHVDSLPSGQ